MFEPTTPFLVVIDLEATCCDDGAFPREETEIIEIGAVLVETASLRITREFQTFVRPVVHPQLTAFCTRLTTITQADVADAPTFPAALDALRNFISGDDALFCSWGGYDRNQFQRDADRHGVALPFGDRHVNLKQEFSRRLGTKRPFGTGEALRTLRLNFEGTPHRGIDDARNLTRLLPFLLGRVPRPA